MTGPGGSADDGLPPTMATAVYRERGVVEVEERPVPRPGAGQVLVEVGHCGICGSDIHMILEGWGKPGVIEGHEWTGVVAAVGRDVDRWAIGDAVVGGPSPRCGRCRRCPRGQAVAVREPRAVHDRGPGPRRRLRRLHPRGRPVAARAARGALARAAALTEPLAVALHGITRAEIVEGDSVMVFGAGPIGALSIAALVARGVGPVTVVEPAASRQQLALELGADAVRHPSELEVFPLWEPDRIAEAAVHVVLECSGKKAAMEAGFCQLRRGGRMVMVGAGIEPPTFDGNRMLLNELSVCGSFVYDEDGFERALELLGDDRFPVDALIAPDDVPLDGLVAAMSDLAAGRIPAKAMVVPNRKPAGRSEP